MNLIQIMKNKTNTLIPTIVLGALGTATSLFLGAGNLAAQDRPPGNFDPEQMRQRMSERMREQFEVKDETEWKLINERITKVMEARRAVGGGFGGPGGFGGRGGPGQMGGAGGPGGGPGGGGFGGPDGAGGPPQPGGGQPDAAQARGGFDRGGGFPGGPGGFMREQNPELDALRQAIQAKAPNADLKARLTQFRDARKKKEADLEKAQAELREILSVRQEAIAVTLGLLK